MTTSLDEGHVQYLRLIGPEHAARLRRMQHEMARQAQLTIAGLVRGAKMFVFSGEERIL